MIKKDLVFYTDDIHDEKECLAFLADQLFMKNMINDKQEYLDAVYRRENEFSTAVGFGVAIPHGMSDAASESFVAFLRPSSAITWGSNQEKVELIFLIGVPLRERNVNHLKYISAISRSLINEEFRTGLLACTNAEEAYLYLNQMNKEMKEESI